MHLWLPSRLKLLYTLPDILSETDTPREQLLKLCKLGKAEACSFFGEIKCSRIEAVSYVVSKFGKTGLRINECDSKGFTALMYCCIHSVENEKLINTLLRHGADPSIGNKLGTPIFFSVLQKEGLKTSRLLLKAGANINRTDHKKRTPLHHAARLGKTSSCR